MPANVRSYDLPTEPRFGGFSLCINGITTAHFKVRIHELAVQLQTRYPVRVSELEAVQLDESIRALLEYDSSGTLVIDPHTGVTRLRTLFHGICPCSV